MTTIMFPGQGIQNKNFGKKLFSKYSDLVDTANHLLGYDITSMEKINYNNTIYTQPLIYIVNYLNYIEFLNEYDGELNYLIGHSLGEINALLASDVFNFIQGLQIVKKRAELMASLSQRGGMIAIIDIQLEYLEELLSSYGFYDLDIANFNSDQQFVIAGLETSLRCFTDILEQKKIRYTRLNVSGPFHSRYLNDIGSQFFDFLSTLTFSPPKIPVISNNGVIFYDQDNVADLLAKQISSPVKWSNTIKLLKNLGEVNFFEIGESKILIQMIKNIVP